MNREEFLAAVTEAGRDPLDFIHLPGPDRHRSPEGCVVVEHLDDDSWRVYREDRGMKDEVILADESSAYDHAFRRWVRWE